MSQRKKHLYEFSAFRLDPSECILWRGDVPVPLTPKVFDTLVLLVENSGHLVEKEELMRRLWPDSFVQEVTLARNISYLRKALGQGPEGQPFIETVPKRGYRFAVKVTESWVENNGRGTKDVASLLPASQIAKSMASEAFTRGAETAEEHGTLSATPEEQSRTVRKSSLAVLVLGLLAMSGIGLAFFFRVAKSPEPAAVDPGIHSLAVLPFQPLGEAGGEPYLELGMADMLITRLSGIHQIAVRPTSTVRKYTNPRQDPVAAGRELKVDAVLEGSIQRLDERMRVTVRLMRVQDGRTLWAGQLDEKITNLFALQDSISQKVFGALAPRLAGEGKNLLTKRYTTNPEAYQLYLRGRYFWNKRNAEGYKKAIEYFQQAITKDPAYALAYAGLADAYLLAGGYGVSSKEETIPRARVAARKAVELDDTLAEAHASLALIAESYDYDWPGASQEFQRAIQLDPNYATAHHWYGLHLAVLGRFEEAIAEIHRALEIDPLSPIMNTDAGEIYFFARRYDRALEQFQRALEIEPNFALAYFWRAQTYEQQGRLEEAIADLQKGRRLDGTPGMLAHLAHAYGVLGKKDEAQKVLKELQRLSGDRHIDSSYAATALLGLGENEQALAWLEKACQERSAGLSAMRVHAVYDPLRSDPRFADLVRRAGLMP